MLKLYEMWKFADSKPLNTGRLHSSDHISYFPRKMVIAILRLLAPVLIITLLIPTYYGLDLFNVYAQGDNPFENALAVAPKYVHL